MNEEKREKGIKEKIKEIKDLGDFRIFRKHSGGWMIYIKNQAPLGGYVIYGEYKTLGNAIECIKSNKKDVFAVDLKNVGKIILEKGEKEDEENE